MGPAEAQASPAPLFLLCLYFIWMSQAFIPVPTISSLLDSPYLKGKSIGTRRTWTRCNVGISRIAKSLLNSMLLPFVWLGTRMLRHLSTGFPEQNVEI